MSRKPINPKLRFEILCRDDFRCQYCGARAPHVELQADHIQAVAGGGGNEASNLITSCRECNIGKGAMEVDPPQHFAVIVYAQELLDEARARFPGEVRSGELFHLIKRYLEIVPPRRTLLQAVDEVMGALGKSETYEDLIEILEEMIEMVVDLIMIGEGAPQ